MEFIIKECSCKCRVQDEAFGAAKRLCFFVEGRGWLCSVCLEPKEDDKTCESE